MANTQNFSSNTGISAVPEVPQDRYPEIYVDNLKIRNGIKILQGLLDTYTGALGEDPAYWDQQPNPAAWNRIQNLTRTYAKASEAIAAGALVNFWNNSGTLGVRNANATLAGKPCHAFATTAVASGSYGEFIQQGTCFLIGSLTVGATYYLSNTNGLATNAPGVILQRIGYAIGPSTLVFRPDLI
jgi:hypothetical protein